MQRARSDPAPAERELDAITALLGKPGEVLSGDTLRAETRPRC